ncbi:MAG: hypothetical protein HUK40_15360 [Desulfobacter sp.]|nr:hypothetical protein [Desulfobacter sp.]WDP87239.1 MAG: hypothetical protein HUN05_20670 [Desulfobacter sp.]
MDLCLEHGKTNKEGCTYLPKVCLTALTDCKQTNPNEAVQFYGKWQGHLWETQDAFYKKEKISREALNTARLAKSMANI